MEKAAEGMRLEPNEILKDPNRTKANVMVGQLHHLVSHALAELKVASNEPKLLAERALDAENAPEFVLRPKVLKH